MHKEVRLFIREVKRKYPKCFRRADVLEVGSLWINGSIRRHFNWCNYIGLDLENGKGVDVVCHAKRYVRPAYFEVVASCEAFEHDMYWKESLLQMYANLKVGGLMIITCASDTRPEHGTTRTKPQDSPFTNDYYKNISIEMFKEVLPPELFSDYFLENRRDKEDLVFYGIKATTNDNTATNSINSIIY